MPRTPVVILTAAATCAVVLAAVVTTAHVADHDEPQPKGVQSETSGTRVSITDDDNTLVAVLNDSPTAQDFLTRLPATIDLETYSDSAKIGYPSRKLTDDGAPKGFEPAPGDFTYYAPYGDIALFFDDSSYEEDLIPLGVITEGLDRLDQLQGNVTFDLASPE